MGWQTKSFTVLPRSMAGFQKGIRLISCLQALSIAGEGLLRTGIYSAFPSLLIMMFIYTVTFAGRETVSSKEPGILKCFSMNCRNAIWLPGNSADLRSILHISRPTSSCGYVFFCAAVCRLMSMKITNSFGILIR